MEETKGCLGGSLNTPTTRISSPNSVILAVRKPWLLATQAPDLFITRSPTNISMADVRKLLQTERRLRETSKSKSNPSDARASTKRTHLEVNDATATKRQKTTLNPSTGLPVDFFDGADEGRAIDEIFEADDGSLSRIEEKGSAKEDDASMALVSNANTNSSTLPSDFFETKSSIPSTARVEVDEDEWAAFQADVAEPPRLVTSVMVIEAAPMANNAIAASTDQDTVDDYAKGEEEDAKQKLMDEFEEMESLEQRVLRLKERREALKNKALTITKTEVVEVELDDQRGEDDEEDGEEDDDFFRARGS